MVRAVRNLRCIIFKFGITILVQKNKNPNEMTIDVLHIPDLTLKLCVFYTFCLSYFPYDGKNSTRSSKSNGKNKKF